MHYLIRSGCRPPLAAEVRVYFQTSLCGICGIQSGTATGYTRSATSLFPCLYPFIILSVRDRASLTDVLNENQRMQQW
jgi:hypothetical protein